jgi:hypothetical protein
MRGINVVENAVTKPPKIGDVAAELDRVDAKVVGIGLDHIHADGGGSDGITAEAEVDAIAYAPRRKAGAALGSLTDHGRREPMSEAMEKGAGGGFEADAAGDSAESANRKGQVMGGSAHECGAVEMR